MLFFFFIVEYKNEQVYTFNSEQGFIFMAQILKESVKKLIVDSAIKDIFDNGYSESSMRRIATNAQMTVGNLYRYFKNKDELVNYIIQPVMDRINVIIEKHTQQTIDFQENTFDWSKVSFYDVIGAFDDLATELVNIYYEAPRPLMIMMMHTKINERIKFWFANLITSFMVSKQYITVNNQKRCELLSRSYAVSLFAGIKECLTEHQLEKEELISVIRIYFRGCFTMIDKNFENLAVKVWHLLSLNMYQKCTKRVKLTLMR